MFRVIREDEDYSPHPKNLETFVPANLVRRESDPKPGTSSNMSLKQIMEIPKSEFSSPISRSSFISKLQLPEDSVIKIQHQGKYIPWSMVDKCEDEIEIRICRPHQNVKPQLSQGKTYPEEVLVKQKIQELEGRLASLEAAADPDLLSAKTDKDLQLLTKQITFLGKRLDEADQAEWIKKF